MSELIGWLMVLGLVVAIVCIFLLSSQLEQHMRSNAEMLLRSNEMILARLERLANPPHEAAEPTIGVVLERRNFPRKDSVTSMSSSAPPAGAHDLSRGRAGDVLSA